LISTEYFAKTKRFHLLLNYIQYTRMDKTDDKLTFNPHPSTRGPNGTWNKEAPYSSR
jgi:hypothetical protein